MRLAGQVTTGRKSLLSNSAMGRAEARARTSPFVLHERASRFRSLLRGDQRIPNPLRYPAARPDGAQYVERPFC